MMHCRYRLRTLCRRLHIHLVGALNWCLNRCKVRLCICTAWWTGCDSWRRNTAVAGQILVISGAKGQLAQCHRFSATTIRVNPSTRTHNPGGHTLNSRIVRIKGAPAFLQCPASGLVTCVRRRVTFRLSLEKSFSSVIRYPTCTAV